MLIKIKCPDCGKQFTIDVPAIDKYKSDCAKLQAEIIQLRKQLKERNGLDYLKNMFGMED